MVKSVNALINRKAYKTNIKPLMKYFGMNVLKKLGIIKGRQCLKDLKTTFPI